jgi:hypothetical protein
VGKNSPRSRPLAYHFPVVVFHDKVSGMMKCIGQCGRSIAVAGLLAIGAHAAWADTPPMQVSLSLTNLNYTLTDLDAADGITPSLTPSASSEFSLYTVPSIGDYTNSVSTGMLPGDQFDASSASVSLPDGQTTATKQGNSQLTTASLSTAALLQGTPGSAYAQVKTYADFTLSAHSKLVITGDLTLLTQIDAAAVSALQAGSPGTLTLTSNLGFSPYISSAAGSLVTNAIYTGFNGSAQYWYWKTGATQSFTGSGADALLPQNDVVGGQIQLEITNNGDTAVGFQFNSLASATASMTTTAAVPEPGTWALMALGLLGMMGAVRRRA